MMPQTTLKNDKYVDKGKVQLHQSKLKTRYYHFVEYCGEFRGLKWRIWRDKNCIYQYQ